MDKTAITATYFCLDVPEVDREVIGIIYPEHHVKTLRQREGAAYVIFNAKWIENATPLPSELVVIW